MNIRPMEVEFFHADRQTDGHDEASSHILFFLNIFHTRALNCSV
jgi:hypothetical protein